ncbi:MAG: hypothetical protein L0228_03945, partial [Planctomycetes bacterium]|nr:hypothetical protein [Planctomycetota bacterium]
ELSFDSASRRQQRRLAAAGFQDPSPSKVFTSMPLPCRHTSIIPLRNADSCPDQAAIEEEAAPGIMLS